MQAGRMRHQVVIEQRSTAQDTTGAQVNTWTSLGTFDANVSPVTGRELVTAQAIGAEISHEVTLRYDPIFADPVAASAYRVRYGTRLFDVKGVVNDEERDRMITLRCTEGLSRIG
jgi:SPP1 family predicted phage head-tail adaptor